MKIFIRSFALFLIVAMTACSPRATPTPSPLPSPSAQPASTETPSLVLGTWHDMVYHERVGQVVLVNGGPENGKSPTDPIELWGWDGERWSLLSADSDGPRWRNFASVTYDSKRGMLILYGGLTAEQDYKDTWEWDGQHWTQAPVEGPGAREAAGMTYDSERGRAILFGGAQSGKMVDDTWEWDGNTWTKLPAEGPSARFPAGFVYDTKRKTTLLFGGHAFDGRAFKTFGDTWMWNGSTWQQINLTGPSPRDGARAIFLPTSGQILLFGGAEIGPKAITLNDTWLWDGVSWKQLKLSGPPARVHPALAFDESRGVVVMTGGSNGPGIILSDTWEWDGQAWHCVDGC